VIAHFDSPTEASKRLMSVGLNAVPTWLKPYKILSNGEKFRANLARQIETGATVDNYTCITNRNVAAATSVSLSRLIREYGDEGRGFKNVVFGTSYSDVVEWLSPVYIGSRLTICRYSRSLLRFWYLLF
jgi:ABC-type ATPase with predicted acetyltransferase domain